MTTKVSLKSLNGKINENIYGSFIEHILTCINGGVYDPESSFSDEDGVRKDVVELAKELAPPVLRFPGGTVMCQYHWEDAVGPMEKRIRRQNRIWGGELDPAFGTAEFVKFCRRIGAEPMICVNMASGTPEEAGNWVEYCNGTGNTYYAQLRRSHGYEEPFRVKYWCIGNESYAEPDIGIHNDVKLYNRDAMEFVKFMKLTDRSIKTVIVGYVYGDWNKNVLDALHPVTDYLSLHYYAGERNKGLYGTFEGEKELLERLDAAIALLEEYPEKVTDFNPWYRFKPRDHRIQIAFDEWNVWDYVDDETYGVLQTYNWRDALWVASVLNDIINRPAIGMANMAQMVNVLAPIVAEKDGAWYQTIAYPLLLCRKNMLGERISLDFESPMLDGGQAGPIEALNLSAVKAENGEIRIIAVNRDFEKDYVISLDGLGMDKAAGECMADGKRRVRMTVLTADDPRMTCSLQENCVKEFHEETGSGQILLRAGSVNLLAF